MNLVCLKDFNTLESCIFLSQLSELSGRKVEFSRGQLPFGSNILYAVDFLNILPLLLGICFQYMKLLWFSVRFIYMCSRHGFWLSPYSTPYFSEKWLFPYPQKHSHPEGLLFLVSDVVLLAIDKQTQYGHIIQAKYLWDGQKSILRFHTWDIKGIDGTQKQEVAPEFPLSVADRNYQRRKSIQV